MTVAKEEYDKIAGNATYKAMLGLETDEDIRVHLNVSQTVYDKLKSVEEDPDAKEYKLFLQDIRKQSKTNSAAARLWAQLHGKLDDKQEGAKLEFTASDYTRIGRETTIKQRAEYKKRGGSCPVCGFNQTLREQSHLDKGREQSEDSEVETLAVSSRPD